MSYLFSGAVDQSGLAAEKALDLSLHFRASAFGRSLARLYSGDAVYPR
jgi:hypothetical protein